MATLVVVCLTIISINVASGITLCSGLMNPQRLAGMGSDLDTWESAEPQAYRAHVVATLVRNCLPDEPD